MSLVRRQLRDFFSTQRVSALVCSAACGADLLALDIAGDFEIGRHIILPFDSERFRETSVTDRPGEWGRLFDRIVADLKARHHLQVLPSKGNEQVSYAVVNDAVLDEAAALAGKLSDRVVAVLVWNGVSRGDGDLTQSFGDEARVRGFEVIEISTRDNAGEKAKL